MRIAFPAVVLMTWVLPLGAAFACPQGQVFVHDGDAMRPLPDVRISDGRQIVSTAQDGRYVFPGPTDGPVFAIKPAGYLFPAREDGLPDFWRAPDASSCDFTLQPDAVTRDALDVLVFSDPQTTDLREVGYYRDDVVAPLTGRHRAALGVTLGDVANDDLSLYPAINAVTAQLGVPWLHVAGNHDLDADAASDAASLQTFRGIYGPDTFAWEEPEAVFVGLDNVIVQPGQRPAYVGGLREGQFAFLDAYLPQVPDDRLLVVMMHIPLFDAPADRETFRDADRRRLYALLATHPRVLLLSGHRHVLQHRFHGEADGFGGATPLHEFNVGAVSGAFWSGAPDAQGIPDARMADGTPNGHASLQVRAGGEYALAWHPARVGDAPDATEAMALHAPRVLRHGAYPAFGVYANVYMGLPETRVEFRVGEGEWRTMQRVDAPDPRLTLENARDDTADALRGRDRSPEAVVSTHLWRGALPTDLAPGEHRVDVRAFDPWQGEQRAQTRYRLQADPAQLP